MLPRCLRQRTLRLSARPPTIPLSTLAPFLSLSPNSLRLRLPRARNIGSHDIVSLPILFFFLLEAFFFDSSPSFFFGFLGPSGLTSVGSRVGVSKAFEHPCDSGLVFLLSSLCSQRVRVNFFLFEISVKRSDFFLFPLYPSFKLA